MTDPQANIQWDAQGVPRSIDFDDQYFCQDNGYEESIHVCCLGNRLEERFRALDLQVSGTFTILETGFGTGLDFCNAWKMWDVCAPRNWKLHFISVELYPVAPDDVGRALGRWSVLDLYRTALLEKYRPVAGEAMNLSLACGRVHLTVVFEDVVAGLQKIDRQGLAPNGADAWFLDGFAPSKNPRMWSDAVFAAMKPLSHSGTTFSTFTVAGFVRRGLQANGFVVEKIPGHGRKNQILTGTFR